VFVRETASFRRALAARRVAARYMWPWFHPLVPWEQFPREAELKRGTMALPVHQSLRPEEMTRIIDTIREWAGA
jgi:dTDP-4-amino-4,6-dideoxygalactose transaminase